MDYDQPPISADAKLELQRMMGAERRYNLVRAARRWLTLVALAVAVLGLLELFLAPYEPGSKSTVYEKLTALQIVGRLFDVAGRVFVLLVGAQLLQLWLDLAAELRGLRDLVSPRR